MAWSCPFQLQPSSRVCEFVHWGLGEEGEAAKRGPERGWERLERSYVLHFLAAAWERSAPPPLRPVACTASFSLLQDSTSQFSFFLSLSGFLWKFEPRFVQFSYLFRGVPEGNGLKDLLLKRFCTSTELCSAIFFII